jgi:hypothetical protein
VEQAEQEAVLLMLQQEEVQAEAYQVAAKRLTVATVQQIHLQMFFQQVEEEALLQTETTQRRQQLERHPV